MADALAAYRNSLAIRERLTAADPSNTEWRRNLSIAYDKVGYILEDQASSAKPWWIIEIASQSWSVSLDPTKQSQWQNLSLSYHNTSATSSKFRASLRRLAGSISTRFPSHDSWLRPIEVHSQWQRNLSISYNKIR